MGCMGALLVNLRLTGKQGYITSYPQFWDTAQKNKFTKRFEQLAGPDFPLDEQGRRHNYTLHDHCRTHCASCLSSEMVMGGWWVIW